MFVSSVKTQAQDVETYQGMTWYLKKSVALDSARSQGKQVFMVWGTTACTYTANVRKRLASNTLKPIVDEYYVLWFADAIKYNRDATEVSDYLSVLTGTVTFPAICIINIFDAKTAYGLKTGPQSERELQVMLSQYVGNDYFADNEEAAVRVYVNGGSLVVKNTVSDELVCIFTAAGTFVDRFRKADYNMTRDLYGYPKGVLFVTGSSGWMKKVIIR